MSSGELRRTPANSGELLRTPANSGELRRTPANSGELRRTPANELLRTPTNSGELRRTPANELLRTPTDSSELRRTPANELRRTPVISATKPPANSDEFPTIMHVFWTSNSSVFGHRVPHGPHGVTVHCLINPKVDQPHSTTNCDNPGTVCNCDGNWCFGEFLKPELIEKLGAHLPSLLFARSLFSPCCAKQALSNPVGCLSVRGCARFSQCSLPGGTRGREKKSAASPFG